MVHVPIEWNQIRWILFGNYELKLSLWVQVFVVINDKNWVFSPQFSMLNLFSSTSRGIILNFQLKLKKMYRFILESMLDLFCLIFGRCYACVWYQKEEEIKLSVNLCWWERSNVIHIVLKSFWAVTGANNQLENITITDCAWMLWPLTVNIHI